MGLVYAQKFFSTPGKKDGLYWATAAGEEPSPLGPATRRHQPRRRYHGYYYRILTGQGKNANGGAYDYRVKGRMSGGFALIAWPAQYGKSGIMSFMVNHDGVVFQKNLGPGGVVARMHASITMPAGRRWCQPPHGCRRDQVARATPLERGAPTLQRAGIPALARPHAPHRDQ